MTMFVKSHYHSFVPLFISFNYGEWVTREKEEASLRSSVHEQKKELQCEEVVATEDD